MADASPPTSLLGDVDIQNLDKYVEAINTSDLALQKEGVMAVRKLLSVKNPPIRDVVQAGILPRLVELLASPNPDVQYEACWSLTNIASDKEPGIARAVVDAVAVPPLIVGMRCIDPRMREQSIWCISNIAGEDADLRDLLFAMEGCVESILLNAKHPETAILLKTATWAISNLCRHKPTPAVENAAPLIPALAFLVTQEDKGVAADALWGLFHLVESQDDAIVSMILKIAIASVIPLLSHSDVALVMPALRVVGELVSGAEDRTQACLDAGLLPALCKLLLIPKQNIRREAAWVASNIAAGSKAQISALLTCPGLTEALLHEVQQGSWSVRNEATWAICNAATAGGVENICILMATGAGAADVLRPLIDVFGEEKDHMQCVVLNGLKAILRAEKQLKAEGNPTAHLLRFYEILDEIGGFGKIEELQYSSSEEVSGKAQAIMEEFYIIEGGEEEEEEEVEEDVPSLLGVGVEAEVVIEAEVEAEVEEGDNSGPVGPGEAVG